MHFDLVDSVLACDGSSITTLKMVSRSEEYLQDHFAGFPVLPGVFMIESLVQAARTLLEQQGHRDRLVLGGVRAVKYGTFVKPGQMLRVKVDLVKSGDDGSYEFKGEGLAIDPAAMATGLDGAGSGNASAKASAEAGVAVSGKFTLRPVRLGVA